MAKEQKLPEPAPVVEAPPPPPKSYRMPIMLGLIVVALAETLLIYMLIPSPEKLKKEILLLQKQVTNIDGNFGNVATDSVKPDPDVKRVNLVEKSLGDKFKVQSARPDEQVTDVFSVTIQVQIEKKDETKFDKVYLERQYAIRDAVTVVLRSSTLEDRNQVSLTTIKRNVTKAVNEVLGTAYVKGVLCIDPIPETN